MFPTMETSEGSEAKNLNFIRKFYFYIGLFPDFDVTFSSYNFKYIKPALISLTIIILGVTKFIFDGSLDNGNNTTAYLTLTSSTVNLFTVIIGIIKYSTWQAPNLGRLFRTIQDVDIQFQQLKLNIQIVHCKWLLLTLSVSFVLVSILGFHAFKDIGIRLIMFGGVDHMALFYVGMMNVLVMQLLCMAKIRLMTLNRLLKNLSLPQSQPSCIMVDAVIRVHNKLGNFCGILQDIFGWHLLGFYFHLMMFTLSSLNLTMDYGLSNMGTTLYCTLGLVTVEGIILAVLCDVVSTEGRRTASIICDFVNVHYQSNSFALKKMNFFLRQSMEKLPKFTAASFFPVDNSLIFMFVNLTATYVIVLIQFRASPSDLQIKPCAPSCNPLL